MKRYLSKEFQGGVAEVTRIKFIPVMNSLEVAELVGKDHGKVIRDIELEMKDLGSECSQSVFGLTSYNDRQMKPRKMYNLSELGCRQMGMRWSAKDRFTINVALEEKHKPMTIEDMIISQAESMKALRSDVVALEHKFDTVVTLESSKQEKLNRTIKRRVLERMNYLSFNKMLPSAQKQMLFEERKEADKKFKRKLFQAIYRNLKRTFGVASYRDIKVAEYEIALNWINSWVESADIR